MMKKWFAILLAITMLITVFAGCGDEAVSSAPTAAVSQTEATQSPVVQAEPTKPVVDSSEDASAQENMLPESIPYPMVTDGSQSINVWQAIPPHLAPYLENVADSAAYRAAAEATGIEMITLATSSDAMEQLQLMFAAGSTGDYDAIVGASDAYGSADGAVEDGVLLDISDYVEEYMPDYYRFLQSDEEVRKLLTTDGGAMVDIAGRGTGGRPQGFGIRKDWLDKSNLEIPKTYDDLYEVLTVFKNEYHASEPLLMYSTGFLDNDFLCAGMGMTQDGYYVEDGTVKFSYLEDSFKEYCQLINQWYTEGLMSRDFISNTQGAGISYDAQMLDGSAGVFMTGVDIFSTGSAQMAADPDWEAVPMADMTRTGVETITVGNTPNRDPVSNRWNVTTGVEADRLPYVLGFINWFFTEEGSLACNFGIEGEGFEYDESGEPRLTELVTNNPEGLGAFISEAIYLNWGAPFSLDERYYDSIYDNDTQASATDIWNSNRNNSQQYHGSLTSEESATYSGIYSDISTYIASMTVSFMTGSEDIDEQWESFVDTVESMNIDACIQLKQAAYDRYMLR